MWVQRPQHARRVPRQRRPQLRLRRRQPAGRHTPIRMARRPTRPRRPHPLGVPQPLPQYWRPGGPTLPRNTGPCCPCWVGNCAARPWPRPCPSPSPRALVVPPRPPGQHGVRRRLVQQVDGAVGQPPLRHVAACSSSTRACRAAKRAAMNESARACMGRQDGRDALYRKRLRLTSVLAVDPKHVLCDPAALQQPAAPCCPATTRCPTPRTAWRTALPPSAPPP